MAEKVRKLKPLQLQAIHLLLEKGERAGAIKETAVEVGLSRPETIWRWQQDPLFACEYQRQRKAYEVALSDESLASKRRRVQLLTKEIEAIKAHREAAKNVRPGEFATTSRAIAILLKQIAEEMGPIDKGDVSNVLTQNNVYVYLSSLSTEELEAIKLVMENPELAPLKRLLDPVLEGGGVEQAG